MDLLMAHDVIHLPTPKTRGRGAQEAHMSPHKAHLPEGVVRPEHWGQDQPALEAPVEDG